MDQPAIDQEEAEPRFLLSTGPGSEPLQADAVAAVLAALQPVALVVRGGGLGPMEDIRRLAHDHGAALLVEDDMDLARHVDGVHLGDIADIRQARERLGPDHLLGVDVGYSRHDAMTSGEDGADYVAFGERDGPFSPEIADLIHWWRDVTVLPCLAYAADAEAARKLADIGADFIGVSSAIWDHPDGPAAAAVAMAAVLGKT